MSKIYTPTFISTATTTAIATGTVILHTISFPIATTGTVTIEKSDGTDYFVFPIGSINCHLYDIALPGGLSVVTSAGDKVVVTTAQ